MYTEMGPWTGSWKMGTEMSVVVSNLSPGRDPRTNSKEQGNG